ncbi:glycoside hydrolase [Burkholderia pseudomallei]|uniref:lysozyme n=1 Tax=Burkholderia pseudomallei TaxID=28450 RepID=UPI0005107AB0|nr:lysozyme [Burkholderia pseudomallei]KGV09674.1 phage lysozyme family protein [Burkholderia pseudomallei MSHR4503]KGD06050.1 phage lysozyme family protein [Burkholderia pseudomallei]KGV49411.1 phage lysozyme family protein [Burkholderia pseudomallei BDU 2]MBF3536120.1 lysozyme [Burkholderia pseudomallei]MBF3587765.1 lysozyme [Burkholderia pseudomallei]
MAAATLIAGFEGWKNDVYVDPVGRLAVCAGHDSTGPDGKPLKLGTRYTDDVCSYLLGEDVATAQAAVDRAVTVSLSYGEQTAYTSFVYNLGVGNFRSSTMLRKLNAGDHVGACRELPRWNKGTIDGKKVVLPGLVKRRDAEMQACLSALGYSDKSAPISRILS